MSQDGYSVLDPDGAYGIKNFIVPYSESRDQRLDKLINRAEGPEAALYWLLGRELTGKLAFLLDPYTQFKFSPVKVASVNRVRKLPIKSAVVRSQSRVSTTVSYRTPVNTADPFHLLPVETETSTPTTSSLALASQPALNGVMSDTTKRTRAIGVNEGEFELFAPKMYSSPWSYSYRSSSTFQYGTIFYPETQVNGVVGNRTVRRTGTAARFTQASLDTLLALERSRAVEVIGEETTGLLSRALPRSRENTLYRSVVELKDLPQTVKSLVDLQWEALRQGGNKYLTYEFGIKPLIKDVLDMVSTPEKVAKRVNYLLRRQGENTTFRSGFKFLEAISGTPGFTYDTGYNEFQQVTSTSAYRKVELRCMVNANVRMPDLVLPTIDRSFAKKFAKLEPYADIGGGLPRFADLYAIIPWTWLTDWFTGMSKYLELIETINADNSVINFGFITYRSDGRVQTQYECNTSDTEKLTVDGVVQTDKTNVKQRGHSSILTYAYQKRQKIGSNPALALTSEMGSMSVWQQSIIGALLAQKR